MTRVQWATVALAITLMVMVVVFYPLIVPGTTTADATNIALLIVAILGIWLTLLQITEGSKTQKAAFFKDLYSTMYSDPDVREAFYQVEYGKFIYNPKFHDSPSEKKIDRLLSFVDLVCDLYDQKIITEREMRFFKYEFARISQDPNVQGYLEFLRSFYDSVGTGTRPFPSFVSYCKKMSREK